MSRLEKKYGLDFSKKLFGSWYGLLKPISETEYFFELIEFLNYEYNSKKIWPEKKNVFKAFKITPYDKLSIIIIGMDPYPNNKATGLAFSNSDIITNPSPSLKKIIRSIEDDYYQGLNLNFDITLENWAKQGVLLLNTALTVVENKIGSHLDKWSTFTESLLKKISEYNSGIIYVLWGREAQKYKEFIDINNNYIIEGEHPSYSNYQGRLWNFSFKVIDELTMKLNGEKIKW
jgi:uracil-DNA glycosylase